MIRRASPGARKVALFAAILGGVGAFAAIFIFAFGGADAADEYGRISLPGKGEVELPEGKVALYYEERVELDENESLDVPDGLRVTARREVTVKSEKVINNAVNLDDRSLREFAKLEIPQAGSYRVSARSSEPGSNSPAVTFGKGQLEGLGHGAIVSGAILGAGLLVALVALLAGRRGYTPPPASFPVPPGGWGGSPGAARAGAGSATPGAHAFGSPPASAAAAPVPPVPPGTDPVEAELRELERQHAAGALSDADYAERRKQVIDAAFGR
ncbi:MAG TPA: hypothetical protein VF712_04120 [Thermoleophilaceae bacterium]|jgi:hypothetical protein